MSKANKTSQTLRRSQRRSPAHRRALLAGAVAAVAILGWGAAPSQAQYRVPQGGDALDANNRLGSGGYNARGAVDNRYRIQDNIVTGNVTGGKAFRGLVPYRAPGQFRDFAAGEISSNFAGISSGATTSGQLINNAQQTRPYYGEARTVAAPSGFVRNPSTGGYLPPAAVTGSERLDYRAGGNLTGNSNTVDNRLDTRLSGFESNLPGGGTDALGTRRTTPPEYLLLGEEGHDRFAAGTSRPLSPYTLLARDNRYNALDRDMLGNLRNELLRDDEGNRLGTQEIEDQVAGLLSDQAARTAEIGGLSSLPAGRATNNAAAGGRADGQSNTGNAGGLSDERRLQLAGPAEQSAQYGQLLERLNRFEDDPLSRRLRSPVIQGEEEQERNPALPGLPELFPRQPDEQEEPGQTGQQPGQPAEQPGARPGAQPDAAEGANDPPVDIRSLASGVSSPTLKQVYEQAEQLMNEGKFVSAIARYDVAERLVPNQPLTSLGRATAELGAGYFRRAALNLRNAFAGNKELMMARLDLPRLLGEQRVAELAETLRQRAAEDRQDEQPVFLLAFLAYNTGNYEQAAAFLELAQERSGDPLYGEISQYWGLAPATPEGGQNAPTTPTTGPSGVQEMSK